MYVSQGLKKYYVDNYTFYDKKYLFGNQKYLIATENITIISVTDTTVKQIEAL